MADAEMPLEERIVGFLSANGPKTAAEMESALKTERTELNGALMRLFGKGLVVMRREPLVGPVWVPADGTKRNLVLGRKLRI